MESADGQRGRDGGSLRRSPLNVIMSQIRRKRSFSDRKPLGRFLSRSSSQTGIPEDGEPEAREDKGGQSSGDSERHMGWGGVSVFLQRLGKKSDSRNLRLGHCDLTATDLLELASLLQFLPQLEEVDVSWNELIGGSLAALTSHMQQVSGIRTLRICSCRLNANDVAALGNSLGSVPLLEILDLSWNSGVGGGALQGLLGKLQPVLRELHLVACQLTAADAAVLGTGGSLRYLPSVRELDLSCNKQLSGGLSRLTCHLAHVTHLESLDLHLCCLSHSDLEQLIQVLPSLTSLTELDVSSNQEAGGVVRPLVSALPVRQMRRLPLNSCSLNEESFNALALVVPYLRSVDVSWCKVVGGRLSLLLDSLQPSIILELRLSSCDLITDDLHHLASRRGFLSSLRVLDLSYNGSVGDEGWSALFSAGGLGSLEDVDVSLRPSSSTRCSAWLPSLLRALPRWAALARLALQRWTVGSEDRRLLDFILRKRSVLLEWDQDGRELRGTEQPEE
uniref:Leucine rich repeat containing 31 n=1 Tax=Amphiprion ocellaris TaxID=80972 RepID=A0A3Q1BZ15_AMPOC